MKKRNRFNSFFQIIQRDFWFLLFVLIAILIYAFVNINCYKMYKNSNNCELYKSIATELAKNADGDVIEFSDDIEVKIVISSTSRFGLFDSLTAELNNGELNFDYKNYFYSMFNSLIVCLFLSLSITIILYFVKCFVFNTFFSKRK